MFCVYCRTPFDETNAKKFCAGCGKELFRSSSVAEPQEPEQPPIQPDVPPEQPQTPPEVPIEIPEALPALGLTHNCIHCGAKFTVSCTECGTQVSGHETIIPAEGWMVCANCNQSFWVICPECQNIQQQEQPQQAVYVPTVTETTQPAKKSGNIGVAVAVLITSFLLVSVIGHFMGLFTLPFLPDRADTSGGGNTPPGSASTPSGSTPTPSAGNNQPSASGGSNSGDLPDELSATFLKYRYDETFGGIVITGYESMTLKTRTRLPEMIDGHPVVAIGGSAFSKSGSMATVYIPSTVKIIGNRAFYDSLVENVIFLPDSNLTDINIEAFLDCNNLNSIIIPDSVKVILHSAFYRTGITSVTVPDGVTEVENLVFNADTKITYKGVTYDNFADFYALFD